jgi:surfactin synthase thioesterase subunit
MNLLPHEDVETGLGAVRLQGHLETFRDDRPLLFAILGVGARLDYFHRLPERFPACDVVICHLPGLHTPPLADPSVAAFAAAFDDAIRLRLPGRWILRFGLSVGGLVALAMAEGDAVLAIDPPFSEALLDPFGSLFPQVLAGVVGVDHRPLLERVDVPAHVLIASRGLIAAADQALLIGHARVRAEVVEGSHDLPSEAPKAVVAALEQALRTAPARLQDTR